MRIFLCGDTGKLNRGCEAIVRGTVEVVGNKELYLATFAPEQNAQMVKQLGVSMIPYASYPSRLHRMFFGGIRKVFKRSLSGFNLIQKPLFDKLSSKDLCLNIGGDTYCYQRPTMSLVLNNYTKRHKIKNILWCCSIEKDKIKGEILKDLHKYEYIFAREEITVQNLIQSGIPKEKIVKVCDPAFFLKSKEVPLPTGFQTNNTVGINLSDCVCYGPYKKSYDNVKHLVEWILKETNMSVCLIPHVYSITDDKHHDLPILSRLHKEINSERVSLVNKDYDCEQLKYIISKCRYFVGARTHSTIAAYSTKIPTLVIGYSVKSKGIATDLFGTYNNYVLPFKEMNREDELLQAFKSLIKNEKSIRQRYEDILPQYKQQLLDAVKKFVKNNDSIDAEEICDQTQCSGCAVCSSVCSFQAITMRQNSQGFMYPQIDKEKCVNCGKCRKTCPVLNKFLDSGKIPTVFASKNNNEKIRKGSSSGGVFALMAEAIIKEGGVVFAPAFDSDFNVKHVLVDSCDQIPKILGSKYVQSDIGDCYKQAFEFLNKGRVVLFSGTPCQIVALKSYLGKDYENLLTQDVICHGVSSPKSWKKYLIYRKNLVGASSINEVVFREKQFDGTAALKVEFIDGSVYRKNYLQDVFIKSYLSNLNLRASCLDCSFKQIARASDVTLGDFWGVEEDCLEMFDGQGVTLIFVHSKKGKSFVKSFEKDMKSCNVCFNNAIKHNSAYLRSTQENPFREQFLSTVTEKNFEKQVKKYAGTNGLSKLRRAFKRFM